MDAQIPLDGASDHDGDRTAEREIDGKAAVELRLTLPPGSRIDQLSIRPGLSREIVADDQTAPRHLHLRLVISGMATTDPGQGGLAHKGGQAELDCHAPDTSEAAVRLALHIARFGRGIERFKGWMIQAPLTPGEYLPPSPATSRTVADCTATLNIER